jgi:hypothetical protein
MDPIGLTKTPVDSFITAQKKLMREVQTFPPSGSIRASNTSISGADLPTYEPSDLTGPG